MNNCCGQKFDIAWQQPLESLGLSAVSQEYKKHYRLSAEHKKPEIKIADDACIKALCIYRKITAMIYGLMNIKIYLHKSAERKRPLHL
jgi:hypothetical protein